MIIQQEAVCSGPPCRRAVWSIARRETAPPGKPKFISNSYLIVVSSKQWFVRSCDSCCFESLCYAAALGLAVNISLFGWMLVSFHFQGNKEKNWGCKYFGNIKQNIQYLHFIITPVATEKPYLPMVNKTTLSSLAPSALRQLVLFT